MIRLLAALVAFTMLAAPAGAATITLISMQYSEAHPVPHLHYEGGTEVGDVERLREAYDLYVRCRYDCIGQRGGATAVLTLNGPGGSYGTGLYLADFLRANHIATVVERGMKCYSACAFAFLGGTGYSTMTSVGTYIDRMVEPGSIVGFHAPFRDEESFLSELAARGAADMMGESRNMLAIMVHELVKWNVDANIIFRMMEMGPDESYDLVKAEDLYLTRTALPPTPTGAWVTDWPTAVRNACIRLLAVYDSLHPIEEANRITGPYIAGIGAADIVGSLSGYRLTDSWLDVGHCSATDTSLATGRDLDLALYFNPIMTGPSREIIRFANRNDGWSSAGIGGLPTKRIFQRGPMNHYFLPVGVDIDSLDLPGEFAILENRFFLSPSTELPPLMEGLTEVTNWGTSRVSRRGDLWLFEQVGNARLFTSAVDEDYQFGFTNEGVNQSGFIREGRYPDGTPFAWFGFRDGDASSVVHAMILKPPGTPVGAEEAAELHGVMCAVSFRGMRLSC